MNPQMSKDEIGLVNHDHFQVKTKYNPTLEMYQAVVLSLLEERERATVSLSLTPILIILIIEET